MEKKLAELERLVAAQAAQIESLSGENAFLRRQLANLKRLQFGHTSERLDPAQLELIHSQTLIVPVASAPAPASNATRRRRAPRRVRVPADLPVEEMILDPEEVQRLGADPRWLERRSADTAAALDRGVFGAPSYVIGDDIFWGQDRLDFVARRLAQG